MTRSVLVIGAAGDVGLGVVRACLDDGWHVLGAGRRGDVLEAIRASTGTGFQPVVGDLETESGAVALATAAGVDRLDAVVNAVSVDWTPKPVKDCSYADLEAHFGKYLRMHVNAAKAIIPRLKEDAVYLAIGGGMADATIPGLTAVSMGQAAQRMLLRGWHREMRRNPVAIRELMIASHVNGESTRDIAHDTWLTDAEIGIRVAEILDRIEDFPDAVLSISSEDRALA